MIYEEIKKFVIEKVNIQLETIRQLGNIQGKMSKKEFWDRFLNNIIVIGLSYGLFFAILFACLIIPIIFPLIPLIYIALLGFSVVSFFSMLSIGVKRLHDAGLNGALILLIFVPLGGFIVLYLFTLEKPNKKKKTNENSFAQFAFKYFAD